MRNKFKVQMAGVYSSLNLKACGVEKQSCPAHSAGSDHGCSLPVTGNVFQHNVKKNKLLISTKINAD